LEFETQGGDVAGKARQDAEKRIGKSILTKENYTELSEKKRRKIKNDSN